MSHEISKPIKVSVIVPVYKVERFLAACLDSLMAQSMQDIEILLIDDGSPDECGRICDEYAAKDSRFSAFHTENHGLSAARNYGIEQASGEYLMFVDSDDWVSPEFCAAAYDEAMEHEADLVMFRYQSARQDGHKGKTQVIRDKPGFKSREEAFDLMLGDIGVTAWNKLYRIALFDRIRYPEGRIYEDLATTHKLIYQADRIWFLNKVLYYHRCREGSITYSMTQESFREAHCIGIEQLKELKAYGYPAEKWIPAIQKHSLSYLVKMVADESDEYYILAKEWTDSIKGFPSVLSWRQKIMLIIYRISPRLFDMICIATGRRLR